MPGSLAFEAIVLISRLSSWARKLRRRPTPLLGVERLAELGEVGAQADALLRHVEAVRQEGDLEGEAVGVHPGLPVEELGEPLAEGVVVRR
jgi:hypothetical protein